MRGLPPARRRGVGCRTSEWASRNVGHRSLGRIEDALRCGVLSRPDKPTWALEGLKVKHGHRLRLGFRGALGGLRSRPSDRCALVLARHLSQPSVEQVHSFGVRRVDDLPISGQSWPSRVPEMRDFIWTFTETSTERVENKGPCRAGIWAVTRCPQKGGSSAANTLIAPVWSTVRPSPRKQGAEGSPDRC